MLRQGKEKKSDKEFLLQNIKKTCLRKKVSPIIVSSAQHLYHAARKRGGGDASRLFVIKRIMGECFYEPIEKYSNLLQKYNEEISIVDVYVLKEDYPKQK